MNKFWFFLLIFLPSLVRASAFPEPMVYDLIRGLDAKKGETEFNVLTSSKNGKMQLNPEFEYALADGLTLELEVPIEEKIHSTKWGLQYSLTGPSTKFMMGLQTIYEKFLERRREEFSLSTIINFRFSQRWSLVSILGMRDARFRGKHDHLALIANFTLFYQISDKISLGLENDRNIYYGKRELEALSIPQVTWKISQNMKLQTGVGFNWHDNKDIEGFGRLIFEF